MPNSPTFLAISDVHVGLNLYNQPELGTDLRRLFVEACRLAVARRVEYLVIAGDLYDSNKPTPDLIRFVRAHISEAREKGVRVVGIAGDHDKPVNTESWARLSGVDPVDSVPYFVGCNYSDNPKDVTDYLQTFSQHAVAEWIFLHCQAPTLWPFCDERKKIDFSQIPLFELYPNLQGIILGDIHKPYESTLVDSTGRKVFIGYCGSLGITSSNEIGYHTGLLYYNGKTLQRLPFKLGRDFIKIDLTTTAQTGLETGFYAEKYKNHRGRRPVFLVEYSPATKDRLQEIRPLYQLGIVRTIQQRSKDQPHLQAVNIRSELNNQARITKVLNELVPDEEVRMLLQAALHTEDPKLPLDEFREKYINTQSDLV